MVEKRGNRATAAAGLMLAVVLASSATPASAAVFNPHFIISDAEMRAADSMSYEDVRAFLDAKGGLGGTFDVDPVDGLLKGAAQLVHDASRRYDINPKYILALIQKESSAVESRAPTVRQLEWATGYALCDGCSRIAVLAQKYKGLGRQIDAGAGSMDWYMKNPARLACRPGDPCSIDNTKVTPVNAATAALYTYTPHLHGNRLLWSTWKRWFGRNDEGIPFPDGTLVRNEETGGVALIQNGRFRPIQNASVLNSRYKAAAVVDLNRFEFESLEMNAGKPIRFADLSLVRTEDGSVYLLVGNARRKIDSMEAFAKIGFNPEEIEDVKFLDIEEYSQGEPITMGSASPLGQLLQNKATGGVYYVESGVKRPIWDRTILAANFSGLPIVPAAREELDALPTGDPVILADGVLVKSPSSPDVYVISEGKKRAIATEDAFNALGYKWTDIRTVPEKVIALHEAGQVLTFALDESL